MEKLSIEGNTFIITDTDTGETIRHPKEMMRAEDYGTVIHFYFTQYATQILEYEFNLLVDSEGDPFGSIAILFDWLDNNIGSIAKSGAVDVVIQDSTSPIMMVKASQLVKETTITTPTAIGGYTINIASAASFVVGQYLTIYNQAANRVYFSTVLTVNTLAITLDTPLDFVFPVGSFVSVGKTNMNVDGSITPQIFGVRNPSGVDIPLSFDITRLMFSCLCSSSIDLSKFGNITGGLVRGIVVRRVDGTFSNIFNAKTNSDLKNIMFDLNIEPALGSQQDGFHGRLTFSGQNKLGAVVRIGADEDLQIVIQDNLTLLTSFTIIAEGSQVVD